MAKNERTPADLWFEAFLEQVGYGERYTFEPNWTAIAGHYVATCPDYLVEVDSLRIACEVKGFGPSGGARPDLAPRHRKRADRRRRRTGADPSAAEHAGYVVIQKHEDVRDLVERMNLRTARDDDP